MQDFTSFFLLLVVITILYLYLELSSAVIKVKADDGNEYLVRNLPDRVDVANKLALIRKRLTAIVDELYNNRETEQYKDKLEEIELLKSNYRPDKLSESSPGNKYTSYSIDKGKKLFIV